MTYNRSTLPKLIEQYPDNLPAYLQDVELSDFTDADIVNLIDDIQASTGETIAFEFS